MLWLLILISLAQGSWQHDLTESFAVEPFPVHCALTSDGNRLLVTHSSGQLSILDLRGRFQADRKLSLAGGPFQVLIHPRGRTAYVSLWNGSEIACVDLQSLTLRKRIPVGYGPAFMDFSPDGRRLYVVSQKSFSLAVIDTATQRTIRVIRLKESPSGVAAARDGLSLFVSSQSGGLTGFRLRDFKVVGSFEAGLAPSTPLAASLDGTRLWGVGQNDQLIEIDVGAASVARRVEVGRGARYLMVSPDERFLYVVNTSGTLSLVDVERFEEIRQIRIGQQPVFGTVSADGSLIFVCDQASRKVHVIERSSRP